MSDDYPPLPPSETSTCERCGRTLFRNPHWSVVEGKFVLYWSDWSHVWSRVSKQCQSKRGTKA